MISPHPTRPTPAGYVAVLLSYGVAIALTLLTPHPLAAEGLENVKSILDKVKTELLGMIPLIAVVALILMGIGYALRFVGKETFIRWMVGLIIAGSAAQITKLFFTSGPTL